MKLAWIALGLAVVACPSPATAQELLDSVYPNGARAGSEVTLTFTGKNLPDPGQLQVEGSGIEPLGEVKKGSVQVRIAADATPGVRQLRVVGNKVATAPRPFVVGKLPERLEKEPNDRAAQAEPISELSVVINGTLTTRTEIDVFRVSLKKGDCLVAAGESRVLGSPTNLLVRIRDTRLRELLVQMDYRTRDPLLGFTAPADGDYYVELQEVMNNYSNLSPAYVYRLVLTTGPWLDYAFPIGGQRGTRPQMLFRGWNLAGRKGPVEHRQVVTIPADASSFQIAVGGSANQLRLLAGAEPELTEEEEEGVPGGELTLPVPGTVNGTFGFRGDRDTYRFSARKGELLELRVDARNMQSFADPVLTLKDATGKVLQTVDDGVGGGRRGRGASRDPDLLWTAPADGEYTVVLQDVALGSRGGPAFFYRFTITPPGPELSATTPAPTILLKPGTRVEVSVTVRQAQLTESIQVETPELPPGVTAAPTTIPAAPGRNSSSEVKLALQVAADLKPGHWPFRIVARSGERRATAAATWVLSSDRSGTLAEGNTAELLLLAPSP